MKKIKFILSVWVCKILILISKLTGSAGSSAPGKYAMRICPEAISIAASHIKGKIIVTCGTNGKTTTNNLINNVLSEKSKTVCNKVGANMLPGIATAFLSEANFFGRLKCDYAVLEIDEAYAVKAFDYFTPDVINLTNLFRDQLDRYGEIEFTEKSLVEAIRKAPGAVLVINADDPVCYSIALQTNAKTVTYSINENASTELNDTKDGKFCAACGSELSYNYYHYSQLGDYYCSCGFKRPDADYRATNVFYTDRIEFLINDNYRVKADYRGFYNIYNILACYAVIKAIDFDVKCFEKAISEFRPQFGRMERFSIGKPVILNLCKNPAGFNQALQTVISDESTKDLIVSVNDNPSDGIDISWFWDVDFEKLSEDNIGTIAVTGLRKDDLNVRFKYADINKPVIVCENVEEAVSRLINTDSQVLYTLVNYTEIFNANKLLKKLEKDYNGN